MGIWGRFNARVKMDKQDRQDKADDLLLIFVIGLFITMLAVHWESLFRLFITMGRG